MNKKEPKIPLEYCCEMFGAIFRILWKRNAPLVRTWATRSMFQRVSILENQNKAHKNTLWNHFSYYTFVRKKTVNNIQSGRPDFTILQCEVNIFQQRTMHHCLLTFFRFCSSFFLNRYEIKNKLIERKLKDKKKKLKM